MWLKLLTALLAGLASIVASVWKAARQLFHETTGALFLVFAMVGALAAWRDWRQGMADWRIGIAVVFAVVMGTFAVASFRSARRVR